MSQIVPELLDFQTLTDSGARYNFYIYSVGDKMEQFLTISGGVVYDIPVHIKTIEDAIRYVIEQRLSGEKE